LQGAGHEVLFMDRPKVRLGVMLADVELMGIPAILVVGDRGLAQGTVEYRQRRSGDQRDIPLHQVTEVLGDFRRQAPAGPA
jgi:prolyl-tRNA synthetase